MKILLISEKQKSMAALCTGAAAAGEAHAIVIGSADDCASAGNYGAKKVYHIAPKSDMIFEDYTETIQGIVDTVKPDRIYVEPTRRCKVVAGRIAAKLGTSMIADTMSIGADNVTQRMMYGGSAIRTEKVSSGVLVAAIGAGVFEAQAKGGKAEVVEVSVVSPKHPVKLVGRKEKPKVAVDLHAAKRIIAVGRGIAKKEDLKLIDELASILGCEVGCTRPLAEGEDWMSKDLYIGVSGLMLTPEIYLGIGVAGQVQHMVGVNRAKIAIAINKDKAAPIFQQVDYGIVADLYKVVPAMIKAMKGS